MLCLVLLAWVSALCSAQSSPNPGASSTAYVGGYWMEGDRFVKRDTTWAKQGVFDDRLGAAGRGEADAEESEGGELAGESSN